MIIAVDFDGVLCDNAFPQIGAPHYEIISLMRRLLDVGHEVILWTSRADGELAAAIDWCKDYGLHFTAVNDNAPSNKKQYSAKYPNGTRKVYADIYIDDHNLEYVMPVKDTNSYTNMLQKIRRGVEEWKTEEN